MDNKSLSQTYETKMADARSLRRAAMHARTNRDLKTAMGLEAIAIEREREAEALKRVR